MAFGKNQLLMAAGFVGVAALYYGYTLYQENPELKLSDLANPEKLKALTQPKGNALEQQKSKVLAKLDESRRAQAEREESIARQTGETNLKAIGDSVVDQTQPAGALNAKAAVGALGAKAAASADAADAALEGRAQPGAKESSAPAKATGSATGAAPAARAATSEAQAAPETAPEKPKDPKVEADRLLSLVRGITPEPAKEEPRKEPAKLAMVDPDLVEQPKNEKPEEREIERTARPTCKKPPRDQVLASLKKDTAGGLGAFTEKWTRKYGACWDGLISVAADSAQDVGLRYFSLRAALEIGGRDSADGVARLLKDKNAGLRCLSLLGLGEMNDKDLAGKIIPSLEDPAMVVRECALTATVRTQGAESLNHVVGVIGDPKNYVKGHPLSIVKRGFDLLDAMGAGTSQEDACNALKERMNPGLFGETTRKWAVCTQSVSGGLTPTAEQR